MRRFITPIVIGTALVLCSACQTSKSRQQVVEPQLSPDEIAVKESLYSEFVRQGDDTMVFLLPDREFDKLHHSFAGHVPAVKSESEGRKKRDGSMFEPKTGKPAFVIEAVINTLTATQAEATVTLYSGPLGAGIWKCVLRKRENRWLIVKKEALLTA